MKRKKGYFSISAVAEMFAVHPQTVRLYEKEGLITPKRSDGNTRMFSEDDVEKLEEVIYLTHQLGINLAGVEMILKLKKQIKKLQSEMNKAFKETEDELSKQEFATKYAVKENAHRLLTIKQRQQTLATAPKEQNVTEPLDINLWEIEYDEKD